MRKVILSCKWNRLNLYVVPWRAFLSSGFCTTSRSLLSVLIFTGLLRYLQFSHVQLFATPRTAARQASLTITNSRSLLKLRLIELWCHLTISSCVIPFSSHLQSFSVAAAAAKSHQSCLTLCDPIDASPTGSSVPGIFQARILEWVAVSFSNAWKWKVKVKLLSCVQPLATPWTVAYQAPLSMGFSRQQYWSGLPLPSPIFLSIRAFSNEPVLCIMWQKYWGFSISPFNEYSGLIFFMMDWLNLIAVQGTLKSLL